MPRQSRSSSASVSSGSASIDNSVSDSQSNISLNEIREPQQNQTPFYHPSQRYLSQSHQPVPTVKPNSSKIESIKNYYYQLSSNLRNIAVQLQSPDLTPGRRQALAMQHDKLQNNLNEFTEKVLKPLMSAARSGTPPAHIDSGSAGIHHIGGAGHYQPQYTPNPPIIRPSQPHTFQGQPNPQAALKGPIVSRHLQIANQHFQDAQQQQLVFQQRLQAKASVAHASSHLHSAGTRSLSPRMNARSNAAYAHALSSSPSIPQLMKATSAQRVGSNADHPANVSPSFYNTMHHVLNDTSAMHVSASNLSLSAADESTSNPESKSLAQARPDLSDDQRRRLLSQVDDVIERIAQQSMEYALHSNSSALSERDIAAAVEDVLGSEWRMPRWAQMLPPQSVIKRPTQTNNTHSSRLAQIKKDMTTLASTKNRS